MKNAASKHPGPVTPSTDDRAILLWALQPSLAEQASDYHLIAGALSPTQSPGKDLEGHILRPMHLCGILKSRVYGQIGGSESGAGMELSYTKPNSFIIKNCRFHPGFRNGTRRPRIFSILTPPNRLMMFAWNERLRSKKVIKKSTGCEVQVPFTDVQILGSSAV